MVQKSLGQLLINYKLSIMSYAPPFTSLRDTEKGGERQS